MKKTVSGIMLTLLFIGILPLTLNIEPVKAAGGIIYIWDDGSIDPPTAPIQRNGDIYTFIGNIYDQITVFRSNIIIDGAGYTLQGSGSGNGFHISDFYKNGVQYDVNNVMIKNTNIKGFNLGIWLSCSNHIISGNNLAENDYGIICNSTSNSIVSGNNVVNNGLGIWLWPSSNCNTILGNNITNNQGGGISLVSSKNIGVLGNNITNNTAGMRLHNCSNNHISGNIFLYDGLSITSEGYDNVVEDNVVNGKPLVYLAGVAGYTVEEAGQVILVNCDSVVVENLNLSNTAVGVQLLGTNNSIMANNDIANNWVGIALERSSYNSISGNNIANDGYGISLYESLNNEIYHNNFVDNTVQATSYTAVNVWDNGYPSGGNYWSDYEQRYPDAEELDDSGIWDTSYVIDENNQDRYPLVNPWRARVKSAWPMFQHDPQHTGRSPFAGPGVSENPEITMLIGETDTDSFITPVISYDGTLYLKALISGKVGLYAFAPNGTEKWFYPSLTYVSSPTLAQDGSIYFYVEIERYKNISLRMVDSEGNLEWEKPFVGAYPVGHPIIDENGIIYFLASASSGDSGKLIALNPNTGDFLWTYEIQGHQGQQTPAIGQNGMIFFGQGDTLFAINPDGTEKWRRRFPATLLNGSQVFDKATVETPSIGCDGTIYVVVSREKKWQTLTDAGWYSGLHAIDPDNPNQERWVTKYIFGRPGPPTIDSDGDIYLAGGRAPAGTWYTILYGFDSQGNDLENWPLSLGYVGRVDLLAVDKEGSIYGLFGWHTVKAFDLQGNQKWSLYLRDGRRSGPVSIGKDGTLYVPGSMWLYAISPAPPTPPSQPPEPVNLSPPDGATDVSLEPIFLSSPPLSDVTSEQIPWEEMDGIKFTRVYYHVQITTIPEDYSQSVYDFTDFWLIDQRFDFPPSPKSPYVSSGVLDYGTTYYWRIRYKDFRDVWSPWSEETSFTTKESREMKITRLITQEAIPPGVPVTVNGQYYIILTLKSRIDPITLELTPDVLTKVYVEAAENYPVSDPETARRIGIIDYARQIAEKAEEIRDKRTVLIKLRDTYEILRSLDLAMAGTNLGVSGVKLITDMKTVSDVLKNIETIKEFAAMEVPKSLSGFFTKMLELVIRKLIYDPIKELENDLKYELSQAIQDYTSVLELLETGEITDYSVAGNLLCSYLSAKAHEDHAKYLFEKILRNYLLIVDELYKPVSALATWGLSNFVFLVKEAVDSFDWTVELLQRQIIASYENFATINFKLLAHSRYTLELANVPSELILELEIKYLNCVAEGYEKAAEAVEWVITPMIPFFMKISPRSPAELRVYDSQGRVTGVVDGEEKIEIPYSAYYENTVILSSADSYYYEVAGTEEGSYGLEVEKVSLEDEESITFVATDIPISANAIHQFTIDWTLLSLGQEAVTVQVDSDGDGVFEHTFTSDSELTQTEYLDAIQGPTPPVGGYSFHISGHTIARSLTSYFAIVIILIAAFVVVRRKKPRKKRDFAGDVATFLLNAQIVKL